MERISLSRQATVRRVPGYGAKTSEEAPSKRGRQNGEAQADVAAERRKLWGQIIAIIVLAVVWVLGFLFWVFPFLVQWTGQRSSEKYVPEEQIIRPQTPLINAPPAYTSEAGLKLAGFGTPDARVQFIVNGEAAKQYLVPVSINGEFSLTIDLQEGENVISAYSFDETGLESTATKNYQVTLDQSVPEINLLEPENGQEIVGKDKQDLLVKGQTEANIKVLVNALAGTSDGEGNFEIKYPLRDGENELRIVAQDHAENQAEQVVKVTFQP